MNKFMKEKKTDLPTLSNDSQLETKLLSESADNNVSSQGDSNPKAVDAEGVLPGVNSAGARDLTDEELKKLNQNFRNGLESMKNHPWNGKED